MEKVIHVITTLYAKEYGRTEEEVEEGGGGQKRRGGVIFCMITLVCFCSHQMIAVHFGHYFIVLLTFVFLFSMHHLESVQCV